MAKTKKGKAQEFETFELDDFGTAHDFEKEAVIIGVVKGIKEIETGTGKKKTVNRIMTLDTSDGIKGVWESKKLEKLFDEAEPGWKVSIESVGTIKVKGRPKGMKDYKVGVVRP